VRVAVCVTMCIAVCVAVYVAVCVVVFVAMCAAVCGQLSLCVTFARVKNGKYLVVKKCGVENYIKNKTCSAELYRGKMWDGDLKKIKIK